MVTTATYIFLTLWMDTATMGVRASDVTNIVPVAGLTTPACAVLINDIENDVLFQDSCDEIKVKLGLK